MRSPRRGSSLASSIKYIQAERERETALDKGHSLKKEKNIKSKAALNKGHSFKKEKNIQSNTALDKGHSFKKEKVSNQIFA